MAAPGRYVIFANLDEGELVTPAFCPQTQPLSGWKDKLAPFRAYARAHRAPATTGGRAAAATAVEGRARPEGRLVSRSGSARTAGRPASDPRVTLKGLGTPKPTTQRDAARATLAREVGYVTKPHAGRLRVALAFPNTYYVGMSNLGFQTVYQLFNDRRRRRLRALLPAAEARPWPSSSCAARASSPSSRRRRSRTSTSSRSRSRSSGTTRTSSRCCAGPACPSTPRSDRRSTRWS